jgi:hypothetical protein
MKKGDKILRCARCKMATYCGAACQKAHWLDEDHKGACNALAAASASVASTDPDSHTAGATSAGSQRFSSATATRSLMFFLGRSRSAGACGLRLLTGGDADLGERFELARGGAPRLSAQKFPRRDLPLAPCTATHEVARMLAALARVDALPPESAALVRLVTFFAGATPRTVTLAVARDAEGRLAATHFASAAGVYAPAAAAPGALVRDAELLFDALLERLEAENSPLRKLVGGGRGVRASLTEIMDAKCDWERAVRPLSWAAVSAAWGAAAAAHGRVRGDSLRLERLVNELADAGLVQRDFGAAQVWPVAAAQVVFVGAAPVSEWATAAGAAAKDLALVAARALVNKAVGS